MSTLAVNEKVTIAPLSFSTTTDWLLPLLADDAEWVQTPSPSRRPQHDWTRSPLRFLRQPVAEWRFFSVRDRMHGESAVSVVGVTFCLMCCMCRDRSGRAEWPEPSARHGDTRFCCCVLLVLSSQIGSCSRRDGVGETRTANQNQNRPPPSNNNGNPQSGGLPAGMLPLPPGAVRSFTSLFPKPVL